MPQRGDLFRPGAVPVMARGAYMQLAALLALLVALDALTIDITLPAMPAIAAGLAVPYGSVEISLSAYLFGIALGQLFQGPASDRFGRKPVLLTGLAFYVAASVGCAVAPSIGVLIASRFVQGLAVSSGQILARAIVRDRYARDDAARLLSFAMIGLAVAPIVAPLLGSALTAWIGWRSIFVLLAGYAAIVAVLIWRRLDETHPLGDPQALDVRRIAYNYRTLLGHRVFWAYTVCGVAAFCGLFTFLTASSGVFINHLGLTPHGFGSVFAAIMIGHGGALLGGAHLVRRYGLDRLLAAGVGLAALAGVSAAALSWMPTADGAATLAGRVLAIAVPIAVYLVAFALIIPQSVAGAMAPFPQIAGAAASLLGFLQFAIAAATVAAVSAVSDGSERAMVTAVAISGVLALGAWAWLVRPLRGQDRV